MQTAIEASGIGKSYGETRALNEISFQVREGEIFGCIGPDGAGKTTLFNIITTLLLPDDGKMEVFGIDCRTGFRELRRQIGFMPGRFSLYHDLTVAENLQFYATVFGTTIRENYDLIADVYAHIEPFRNRLAGKLSGGMKQKLALSCALIHRPRLLVLDEPTTGVDAVSRTEFWEMLAKLKNSNITVIVSTPYMDEAMRCDRVALIQKGSILSVDTPANIRSGFKNRLLNVSARDKYRLILALRDFPGTGTAYPFGGSMHLTLKENYNIDMLRSFLAGTGIAGVTIEEGEPGIEDRFLELMELDPNTARTGKEARP
jgi:ABC-type multidrug transport system ATPase subunit